MGKAKNALMKAKHAAGAAVSKEGIGKTGLEIVELGSSALLGLASKNMELPYGVKPDVAGVAAGLALMLSGGKRQKMGRALFKGALNACIGRAIWDPKGITLIQGTVAGPAAAPAKPLVGDIHVNVGKDAMSDDADDSDDDSDDDAEPARKAA